MSEVVHVIHPDSPHSRLGKWVAVWLVASTLAAAVGGYLEEKALTAKEDAAREAQSWGIDATISAIQADQRFYARYELFALAEEERYRASLAQWETITAPSAASRASAAKQIAYWTQLARRSDSSVRRPITVTGPGGPENDPEFPNRLRERSREGSYQLIARQDSANAEASAWGKRVAAYAGVLTLLAVALYLLGFSYRLGGGEKRLFIGLGACFSLLAIGLAAKTAASPPKAHAKNAAKNYAQGVVELRTARNYKDLHDAITKLTAAIDARPNFGLAYVARGDAFFEAGSPQYLAAFPSLTRKENLSKSIKDLRSARRQGIVTYAVLGNLGNEEFLLALRRRAGSAAERALLEHALSDTERGSRLIEIAAETKGRDEAATRTLHAQGIFLLFNRGVQRLALGKVEEAKQAYHEAVARMKSYTPQGDWPTAVAGALTDLEALAAQRPSLWNQARTMKELVVARVWGTRRRTSLRPYVRGGRVDLGPTRVELSRLRLDDHFRFAVDSQGQLRNDADVLTIFWYTRGRENLGWYVLPEVSGLVFTQKEGLAAPDLQFDRRGYFVVRTAPCLPPGDYHAELYVNGALQPLQASQGSARFGSLRRRVARGTDAQVCIPRDWKRSALSVEGLLEGYVSRNRTSGAYVLRVPSAHGSGDSEQARIVRDRFMRHFATLLTATPRLLPTSEDPSFMNLGGASVRDYAYGRRGRARVGAAVTGDGEVIVGLVYGPSSQFKVGRGLSDVFDSMSCVDYWATRPCSL